MKLDFTAPDNFLPLLPTALAAQMSHWHLRTKLVFAAPESGLPLFPSASLSHVSRAEVDPAASTNNSKARNNPFTSLSFQRQETELDGCGFLPDAAAGVTWR
jgi:hypothetical protein